MKKITLEEIIEMTPDNSKIGVLCTKNEAEIIISNLRKKYEFISFNMSCLPDVFILYIHSMTKSFLWEYYSESKEKRGIYDDCFIFEFTTNTTNMNSKIQKVVKEIYRTSDGKEFDSLDKAELYVNSKELVDLLDELIENTDSNLCDVAEKILNVYKLEKIS